MGGTDAFGIITEFSMKLLKYSTPASVIWWTTNFIFRALIIFALGQIYSGNELSCVSNSPGCEVMCNNFYAPMVHTRFWSFQLFFCCLPSFVFIMITTNYEAQLKKVDKLMPDDPEQGELISPEDTLNKNNSNTISSSTYQNQPYQRLQRKKEKLEHKKKEKQTTGGFGNDVVTVIWTPAIRFWFCIQLLMKIILELVFVYFYYLLQRRQADNKQEPNQNLNFFNSWRVPYTYSCTLEKIKAEQSDFDFNACQNDATQCWVPRPVEKRVMMWYMLTMSVVSTSLVIAEFLYVVTKITVKSRRRRKEKKHDKDFLRNGTLSPKLSRSKESVLSKQSRSSKTAN